MVQSLEVIQVIRLKSFVTEQQNHSKRAHGHDGIGQGIEHGGRITLGGTGQQPQQKKAHMRDGRVSQHAFDIGLRDGDDVTYRERKRGKNHQHLLPIGMQIA